MIRRYFTMVAQVVLFPIVLATPGLLYGYAARLLFGNIHEWSDPVSYLVFGVAWVLGLPLIITIVSTRECDGFAQLVGFVWFLLSFFPFLFAAGA